MEDNRIKLINKAKSLGYPDNEIVFTLEDFFEGNYELGSIGVNIYPDPILPQDFYTKLISIRKLEKVDNIFVRISDIDDEWPYSDAIYIVTNLLSNEIKEYLQELQPDEIYEGWMYDKPVNVGEQKKGYNVYSVWWD